MDKKPLSKKISNNKDITSQSSLKQKIDDFINNFDNFHEVSQLETIDNILQQKTKLPNSTELSKDLLLAIEKYKYVENGSCLKNSVHYSDRDYAKTVRKAIIEEYKVKSITDKMMVDLATASYFRSMRASSIYNTLIEEENGMIKMTAERNGMLKELNKQIEMATRQFSTIIAYLRERNNPPINIKVKTDNAFIANNQQFNKNA